MTRTPRGVIGWAAAGAATLLVAWIAARGWWPRPGPSPAPSPVVEIAGPPAWMAERAVMVREAKERDGLIGQLRDQLAGRATLQPKRILVYDTVVRLVRDTVILSAKVDGRGRIDVDAAIPADSGQHRPVGLPDRDVGECDDALVLRGLEVLCDRARAGHVVLIGRAGFAAPLASLAAPQPTAIAEAAVRWERSFRSPLAVELVADRTGRVRLTAEWGVRLF